MQAFDGTGGDDGGGGPTQQSAAGQQAGAQTLDGRHPANDGNVQPKHDDRIQDRVRHHGGEQGAAAGDGADFRDGGLVEYALHAAFVQGQAVVANNPNAPATSKPTGEPSPIDASALSAIQATSAVVPSPRLARNTLPSQPPPRGRAAL